MISKIGERLLTLMENGVRTDMTFIVQGTEIKCHRLVLISHESGLKYLAAGDNDHIQIDDITPATFQAILKYLYSDDCEVRDENVFELFHASKKFSLTDLEEHCSQFIQTKLNASNLCFYTDQALNFDAKESLKVCRDFFKNSAKSVISSRQWIKTSNQVLVALCDTDTTFSQVQLFSACVRWSKAECQRKNMEDNPENLRNVLGEIVNKIQYKRMDVTDFIDTVIPTRILTNEQVGRHMEDIQQHSVKVSVMDLAGRSITLRLTRFCTLYDLRMVEMWGENRERSSLYQYRQQIYFTTTNSQLKLDDAMTLGDLDIQGGLVYLRIVSPNRNSFNFWQ